MCFLPHSLSLNLSSRTSLPPTYIVWMLMWCTAKYGYNIQLYGGLGMRYSVPLTCSVLLSCVECWSLCTVTLCTLVVYLTLMVHTQISTIIITGWMDRIDSGFTERASAVCEDAIGSGCTSQHAEKGDWCHYTLCTCNAACTQSPH